jgi:hypothetical protein
MEVPNSATTSYRFPYVIYGVATKDAVNPEEALVKAIYEAFYPISQLTINLTLVWRRTPKFEQEVVPVFGKTYATFEDVQDNIVKLPLPIDAVEDFETRSWRQMFGTELRSKLTMRLVIPALNWCPQHIPFESDGMPLTNFL